MEVYERMLREDPEFLAARTRSENRWWRARRGAVPVARVGVTTIPVVVHVGLDWDRPSVGREPPRLGLADLGYDQGWRVDRHVRALADTTGDRQADLAGFGEHTFMVGRGQPDGGYDVVPQIADFAYVNGGWRVDRHVRAMADVTAEGRADAVGFGDAGVWVSMAQPDGTFSGSPPPGVRGRGRDWSTDIG